MKNKLIDAIICEIGNSEIDLDTIDTVYIGGGTPSLLDYDDLEGIMRAIRRRYSLADNTEITLEVNPCDIRPDSLSLWQAAGINRISIGIQSLDDDLLQFLGRRHNAAEAIAAIEILFDSSGNSSEGALTWGADLLMGIPGQTLRKYQATIERILTYTPEHLACYQLTIEPGTPMADQLKQKSFTATENDEEAVFFELTQSLLTSAGYIQYEVSNYACDPDHLSRHNVKYWHHVPYLGFGPSAHSYRSDRRWWNVADIGGYIEMVKRTGNAVSGEEILDESTKRIETIMLGFRTMWGCDRALIDPGHTSDVIRLEEAGLLKTTGQKIVPTQRGLAVADSIVKLLLPNSADSSQSR